MGYEEKPRKINTRVAVKKEGGGDVFKTDDDSRVWDGMVLGSNTFLF